MTIISDSYMGMFLPSDIYERISKFLSGSIDFPFIKEKEIMGIFFLFGKNYGIKTNTDILSVKDIVRRTIDQMKREVILSKKIIESNIDLIKENYHRRILQIYSDSDDFSSDEYEITKRIASDPSILISCYSQHIANYKQNYFFEIFGPIKKNQLDRNLNDKLLERMIVLSYNCKHSEMLPFNTFEPFSKWITNN